MNPEGLVPQVVPRAVRAAVDHTVKVGATKWFAKKGGQYVAKEFMGAYVRDLGRQIAEKGSASAVSSMATAVGKVSATQTAVNTLVPFAGKLVGGAVAGPVAEALTLALDKDDHTTGEYAEAVGRGTVSGVAGVLASAGTAALAGTLVAPGLGTAAGLVAGIVASSAVNSKLKDRWS